MVTPDGPAVELDRKTALHDRLKASLEAVKRRIRRQGEGGSDVASSSAAASAGEASEHIAAAVAAGEAPDGILPRSDVSASVALPHVDSAAASAAAAAAVAAVVAATPEAPSDSCPSEDRQLGEEEEDEEDYDEHERGGSNWRASHDAQSAAVEAPPQEQQQQQQQRRQQQLAKRSIHPSRVGAFDGNRDSDLKSLGESLSEDGPAEVDVIADIYPDVIADIYPILEINDLAPNLAHVKPMLSSDAKLVLADVGMEFGADTAPGFVADVFQSIPDHAFKIQDATRESPSRVNVESLFTGTQIKPLLPFFPPGKNVCFCCHHTFEFNPMGQIREHRVYFTLHASLQPSIIEGLSQASLTLASTSSGSCLLQDAMAAEGIGATGCAQLVQQLRGHIRATAASPHGNHVLQNFIAAAPSACAQFILAELSGHAVEAAKHQQMGRVVERLLEHCSDAQRAGLEDELLPHAAGLCRHAFGNFVTQQLLEHGSAKTRSALIGIICAEAGCFARHKATCNLVRRALVVADDAQYAALATARAPDRESLVSLSKTRLGSYIVRELKHQAKLW
eukprot:CAMPEP_0115422886 /NCGR_PEP_ID=MMETSP0271-20121206/27014_1 /TAXON_ID=71861 /ORGANISM="Scrippsiella trochoidea, Strain CCMP3099" /LENGTH=563 /DNA_ID=CAMNT_0002847605 /DNA_START=39 /DNA_END=1727 /DNA_ORIENTATION=+